MQIVIDLPEEIYMDIKEEVRTKVNTFEHIPFLHEVISVGTPLPTGHRGIVDLKSVQWAFDDAIVEDAMRTGQARATHNEIASILETVPTIIEADKVESEEV